MTRFIGGERQPLDPGWSPSPYSCPDCGGVLQTAPDREVLRYRCRVGHAYTASHLLQKQGEQTEEALWAAIRRLEEHASMLTRLAELATGRTTKSYRGRAEEACQHAQRLRSLLLDAENAPPPGPTATHTPLRPGRRSSPSAEVIGGGIRTESRPARPPRTPAGPRASFSPT